MENRTKWLGMLVLACGVAGQASAVTYGKGVRMYSTGSVNNPTVYSTTYTVSTKTSAAIQTAVNKANAAGGGTVELQSGTYWFSGPVILKSNVKIQGAGETSTYCKRKGSWNPTSTTALFYSQNAGIDNVFISDMTIAGNYTVGVLKDSKPPLYGVLVGSGSVSTYNSRIKLQNVTIKRCEGGLLGGGITHLRVQYCDLMENGSTGLYHNFYMRRLGRAYFYKTDIRDSIVGNGFKLYGGTYATSDESKNILINYCNVSNNAKNNIAIHAVGHSYYHHNTCNSQKGTNHSYNSGLYMGATTVSGNNYVDCINNIVRYNAKHGIRAVEADHVNIQGNYCRDNGGDNYSIIDPIDLYCDYNTSK